MAKELQTGIQKDALVAMANNPRANLDITNLSSAELQWLPAVVAATLTSYSPEICLPHVVKAGHLYFPETKKVILANLKEVHELEAYQASIIAPELLDGGRGIACKSIDAPKCQRVGRLQIGEDLVNLHGFQRIGHAFFANASHVLLHDTTTITDGMNAKRAARIGLPSLAEFGGKLDGHSAKTITVVPNTLQKSGVNQMINVPTAVEFLEPPPGPKTPIPS